MLTKSEKSFAFVFIIILIAELICVSVSQFEKFHFFTKPLILTSLIIYFWLQSTHLTNKTSTLMLLALLFSLLGDILLLFVDLSSNFFIGGLLAFLMAHVMYIMVFLEYRNTSKKGILFSALLFIIALGLFYVLKDGLGNLLIPVIVYMLAILIMVRSAFLRKDSGSKHSYILVFLGALLFMISDSVLALNKFYTLIPYANLSIMLSYSLAQFCIVYGVLKQQ